MYLHAKKYGCACSCKRVREVVRVCMLFPVCLCFGEERPGKTTEVKPQPSESLVNGGGLGSRLSGGGG